MLAGLVWAGWASGCAPEGRPSRVLADQDAEASNVAPDGPRGGSAGNGGSSGGAGAGGGKAGSGGSTGGSGGTAGAAGAAGTGGTAGTAGAAGTAGTGVPPTPDAGVDRPAASPTDTSAAIPVDTALMVTPDAPPVVMGPNLTLGLIGRWKLDEGTGTTTADSTATGNNGTLVTGANWSKTGFPGATFSNPGSLVLDGLAGYVTLGTKNLPVHKAAQSLALWFNYAAVPAVDASPQDFASLTEPMAGAARLQMGVIKGKVGAWKRVGEVLVSAAAPAAGWHHFAYTFDGTIHRLYIDGTEAQNATIASDTGAPTSFRLGSYNNGTAPTEFFKGGLDEVRLYNRALTPAEVADLRAGKQ